MESLIEQGLEEDAVLEGQRDEKVSQIVDELQGVKYSIIGEVGASALDMAGEATIRMDNLTIARQMEERGDSALDIRMATGWERGADSLWRYEVMDAEVNLYDGNETAIRKQIAVAEEEGKDFMQQSKVDTKELRERTNAYLAEMRDKYGVAEGEETDAMTEEEIAHLQSLTGKEIAFEDYKERRRNELYNRRMALEAQLAYVIVKNTDAPAMILNSRLGHVLKGEYADQLFKAYPSLKDMEFRFVTDIQQRAFAAYAIDGGKAYIELNVKKAPVNMVAPYLMHEVQHAIQAIEGFAEGGSPAFLNKKLADRLDAVTEQLEKLRAEGKTEEADALVKLNKGLAEAVINNDTDDYGNYQKLMGEVEARNVSARINMSAEERLNTLLSKTEDVAREDQIFLRDGVEMAMAEEQPEAGEFGPIFMGFKGNPVQAAQYLVKRKTGDAVGVFSNPEIGEIDLIWGDEKGGLAHIIDKHIVRYDDFDTLKDAMEAINKTINDGELSTQTDGRKVFYLNGNKVIVEKTNTTNWVLTAYDSGRKLKKKKRSEVDATLVHQDIFNKENEELVSPNSTSANKDTTSLAENQTNEQKFSLITPEMDADYLSAVERGDMATAQQMVMEAAKLAGYSNDESWRMNHRAPRKDEDNVNPFNTEELVPADFWTHPEWYTQIRHNSTDRESYSALKPAIDKYKQLVAEGKQEEADAITVTMYRGVDKRANSKEASFRNGDWITPSREYAKMSAPYGNTRVIKQDVPLKSIWWDGNSINEWGYDDGSEYAYKDTKNNRKLLDPVTYDDNGNVIPLSERFNPEKEDIRYSLQSEEDVIFEKKTAFLTDLVRDYNIPLPTFIAQTKEEFKRMAIEYGIPAGEIDVDKDRGYYCSEDDIILVNAALQSSRVKLHETMLHEHGHHINKLYLSNKINELADRLNPEDIEVARKEIYGDGYADKDVSEIINELVCFMVGHLQIEKTKPTFEGKISTQEFIDAWKKDIDSNAQGDTTKAVLYEILPLVKENLEYQKKQYETERTNTIVIARKEYVQADGGGYKKSELQGYHEGGPIEAFSRDAAYDRRSEGADAQEVTRYSLPDPDPSDVFFDENFNNVIWLPEWVAILRCYLLSWITFAKASCRGDAGDDHPRTQSRARC